MNRFFAPGREFTFIEAMFGPDHFRQDGTGLGDDAFLFRPTAQSLWAVTTDAGSEGVHYRLDWVSPARALRKILLANLSDINAMGGRPRHAFLNLGALPSWDETTFTELGQAMQSLEAVHGFKISGGDTVRVRGDSFFAFTVMGEIAGKPLLRNACKPGHRIYVSGTLGGSAAGLSLLESGESPMSSTGWRQSLLEAHFDPNPPLALGPALAACEKSIGAIDISDGLSSELWHLSRQSGCALRVEWSKLPMHPELRNWANPEELRNFILNGGEEYQLLFTGDLNSAELADLQKIAPISEIGRVEAGSGVTLAEGRNQQKLSAGGFSHA